jgi:hypothetical protein
VDQKTTHKTPEELEEAVGRKIDELFGDLFADEGPQDAQEGAPSERDVERAKPVVPSKQPARPRAREISSPKPTQKPVKLAQAPKPSVQRPEVLPKPGSSPATAPAKAKMEGSFEDVVEQMDILLLNLEWEVSAESINGLIGKFREVEKFFAKEGQGRTILAMNQRALQRFSGPDCVPHPALVKLLQDSLAALRLIHSSRGKRPAGDALIASISTSYRVIMGKGAGQPPKRQTEPAGEDERQHYVSLIGDAGSAIHSLEEVSQRLGRILGVLRQGGDMSTGEIVRRLGGLDQLLSERIGQLLSFYKELVAVQSPVKDGKRGPDVSSGAGSPTADRLFLVVWYGISLAIPSSSLAGLYPLAKAQVEQFQEKRSILIGSRQISRLPLKKPQGSEARPRVLPSWLAHLSYQGKDFFLLLERVLGFREAPEGANISSQARIKIGATSYVVLKLASFR